MCNFSFFYHRQHPQQVTTRIHVVVPKEVTSSTIETSVLDAEATKCSATEPTLTSSGSLPGDGKPVRVARSSPQNLGARVRELKPDTGEALEDYSKIDSAARKVECSVPCL